MSLNIRDNINATEPAPQVLLLKAPDSKPARSLLNTLLLLILPSVILAVTIGFSGYIQLVSSDGVKSESSHPKAFAGKQATLPVTGVAVPIPTPPRDEVNPITGTLHTAREMNKLKSRYPIAVMISNATQARPQSGYNSADIVFEALTEYGITRTMAVYWSTSAPKIGSIRSARQCFVEWLLPFDALYAHIGYAATSDPRTNAYGSIRTHHIKTMNRGRYFWRVNSRYAPHNAYTSTDLIYQIAPQWGYKGKPAPIPTWKFKDDLPLEQRGNKNRAQVYFWLGRRDTNLFEVTWKYDKAKNIYYRYNLDTPYIDAETKAKVYAKNVVIQRVRMIPTYDSQQRVINVVTGKGNAIVLRDGLAINATWKKSLKGRTMYFDTAGSEIEFNRGRTWVVAVPIEQGKVIL